MEKFITERQTFDQYFMLSLDLLCIADTEGRFIRLNPEWEKTLGYKLTELEGRAFMELVHPDDFEATQNAVTRLKSHQAALNFENRYRCKDGSYRWIEWRSVADGTLIYAAARDVTARRQMEDALRQSEALYRSVIENIQDAYYRSDIQGNLIMISPSGVRLLGYASEAEILGRPLTSFWYRPEERQTFIGEIERNGGRVSDYEITLVRKDGTPLVVATSSGFYRNEAGAIAGVEGIYRDMTARLKAERDLRESEARFSKAFQSSPAPQVISEIDTGRFIAVNDRWVEMLEFSREEQIGKPSPEVGIWANPAERKRMVAKLRQQGFFHDEPIEFKTKSGRSIFARWSAEAITLEGRNVMLSMIYNETERKAAEETLRASEERLAQVLTAINDGFWDWDISNNTAYFDPRYFTMAGYEPNAFPHTFEEWEKRVHPDDLDDCKQRIADHFAGRRPRFDIEFRFLKQDGDWIWLRGRGRIVQWDVHGQPKRMVGTHTDISDRKHAEAAQARLQAQLLQSQKMESVGILAGGVAHDFNNLLQGIGGYVELLLLPRTPADADYAKLQAIEKAVRRAAGLVRQLLLFSRKADTLRRPLNLNREVQEALLILERTVPRMIILEHHPAQRLWTVNADAVQIQQILLNLGGNAADAMPQGGRLVFETSNVTLDDAFARTHAGAIPGHYVCLNVTDTGCGMDAKTLRHIFDPFFTTKEFGRGTGLGLASVYGIVKAHDGYILCYSEPGQGTRFTIYLPAADVDSVPETASNGLPPALTGGAETILVVDDEAVIRELVIESLQQFGYTVHAASSGEAALQVYQTQSPPPDLVILDIGMPGMGGERCLQELLKLNPAVKALIASGYAAMAESWEQRFSGARGFITKPYQLADLLQRIRQTLSSKADGSARGL